MYRHHIVRCRGRRTRSRCTRGLAPSEVGSARRAVAVEHVDEGSVRSRGVERGDAGDEGVHVRAGARRRRGGPMIRRRRRIAARGVRGSTRDRRKRRRCGARREPAVNDVDVGVVVCVYALEVGPRLGVGARDVVGARAIVEPGADIRRAPAGSLSGVRGVRESASHVGRARRVPQRREPRGETARAASQASPRGAHGVGRDENDARGEGRGRRAGVLRRREGVLSACRPGA